MASGDVHIYSCSLPMAASLVSAGKLRVIAVNSPKRCKFYPEVPTTVEQGFPNMISEYWIGYTGPPRLPKNVVQKWIDVVKALVDDPENAKVFDKVTVEPAFLAGEDFRKFVMDEAKEIKSVKVIKPTQQ